MKNINYFFQSIIIYFFFIIIRLIGIKLARKLFCFIFKKIAPIFKSKKIINENIKIFSNSISKEDKNKIVENMWNNYAKTFTEYIFLDHFRKNNSHIKIIGEKNLKDIINQKKQVVFISGHFSNFELMSMEITKKNIKLATIYRPLNNFFLNPFMEYLRKKYICKNQIKKGINGLRDAIQYVKNGHSIALMIDQRVSEGEKVDFFGKPAFTTTLPAQLSLKYNLPIIPVFIERTKDDNFILNFLEEIKYEKSVNKIQLTKKLNEILEKMILKNPNEWIWSHNRWKL